MKVIRNIINSRLTKNGGFSIELQAILGFKPNQLDFYQRAFTHRSLQETDELGYSFNYERLEFLGDAVLDTVVSAYLYKELPDADEGYLTQMRSKIVSHHTLNIIGKDFGLLQFLKEKCRAHVIDQLGENIHGDLVESLIGAIYQDKGFKYCERFIYRKVIGDYVDLNQLNNKIISYKSHLIEWCQKEKKPFEFKSCKEPSGNTSDYFKVNLHVSGHLLGEACSISKKKAEEKAARQAYFSLQNKATD